MSLATGSFTVNLTPEEPEATAPGVRLGRLAIAKTYEGDLEATATGVMLSAVTAVTGSAGYVAIETVTGMLHGRQGSFVLQHHGLMDRGAQALTVTVIPDSATGELSGLRGTMRIMIEAGHHRYELTYSAANT